MTTAQQTKTCKICTSEIVMGERNILGTIIPTWVHDKPYWPAAPELCRPTVAVPE